jgi:hypothetical protein
MTVMLDRIAQELTIPSQELERRSLLAYIERERRLANLDIADLQDRYGVRSPEALVARIEQAQVYAHPAWEELIEWEHLTSYQKQLDEWQAFLESPYV